MLSADAAFIARAGDVLLFHRPTNWQTIRQDPKGTFFTALIHLTTRSRYNHAALALGDGKMVEATAGGVNVNDIASSTDDITVIHVEYDDAEDLEDVLAYSTACVGTTYGYLNAFWCGLRNVLPGAMQIKHGGTLICSELVAESLERAGEDFDKDSALVSPGDLADHFGVPRR